MEWIITYFSIGVVLTIVLAVLLLGRSVDYILSEVIFICVGTLLTWPVFFPIHFNEYLLYYCPAPKHLDCRLLRRLRRKARRHLKNKKVICTLQPIYREYDGKLRIMATRCVEMDFTKDIEAGRRQWILQEVEKIKRDRRFWAHVGPMG